MWRATELTLGRIVLLASLGCGWVRAGETWNQFRGGTADGKSPSTRLPTTWNEQANLRWKTPLPGKAWASPVVGGGKIWLANASADGRRLSVTALDVASGRVVHDVTVFTIAEPMYCHDYNSYASPTPVIEGRRLWVHYGSAGTACLDTETAEVVWSRQDLPCDHHRGPGSSPILHENLLVLCFDGFDVQYVTALEKDTGKTVWKTDRTIDYGSDNGDLKKAYCTPIVIEHRGRLQLVCPAAAGTVAYDPLTGRELWKVMHGGFNTATRPLFSHGLVVVCMERGDRLLAIRPDGSGDITKSGVAWRFGKSTPSRPSQSVVGDHLYMVSDTGIFSCIDVRTGDLVWSERRSGRHSASLVESGGRLYAFDEDGVGVVFEASPQGFRVLAENTLAAGCMASPAVFENDLIVRTKEAVYRIGGPGDDPESSSPASPRQ